MVRSSTGEFDSDEFMVRNADQLLPSFIVHYRVKTPLSSGSGWLAGTIKIALTTAVLVGGLLLAAGLRND
jgi:hypothetical protein